MTWQLSHSRQLPGKAWADSMPTLSKSGPCASSQRTEPEALIRGVGGRGGCVQETLGPGSSETAGLSKAAARLAFRKLLGWVLTGPQAGEAGKLGPQPQGENRCSEGKRKRGWEAPHTH